MARLAWQITREMFLAEEEVAVLLGHVRAAVGRATGRGGHAARVDRLIIECLLFSGLRTSEFCALRLGDTGLKLAESVFVVSGRGRQRRTVYVPADLTELLRDYAVNTRPAYLPEGVHPEDGSQPLILNERRKPYERTGLYRRVKRVLTEAGLGARASVQLLRHTYGFLAYVRTGGNLLFVQRQLGHAHPMITSVYADLIDESYEAMAAGLYGAAPAQAEASQATTEPGVRA